jgi:hypothetical protein
MPLLSVKTHADRPDSSHIYALVLYACLCGGQQSSFRLRRTFTCGGAVIGGYFFEPIAALQLFESHPPMSFFLHRKPVRGVRKLRLVQLRRIREGLRASILSLASWSIPVAKLISWVR